MSLTADILRDLGALARHPRRWWYNATHAPCPVCGQSLSVGKEWHAHRAGHDPAEWRAAVQAGGRP